MEVEMESSGRSVDRSKEHSIKKPRIAGAEDSDMNMNVNLNKDRGFGRYAAAERERSLERAPAPAPQRGSPMLERMRAIEREREREREGERRVRSVSNIIGEDEREKEREREESSRGSQQELVNQYKTALGELTFNSKPIITNLTIIAGENSHAAKGIAATVCSHILEVPNEQKLPSLYLLDSIVKNIGGDYVKYFVARLPEVFCKAYRQVDPATHPGMQHLFRTWRGVFPPMPLRIIEEELQFPPSINGSSSGTTTTPRSSETQSQRPGHSIHVNPKYLEARQRLQQSNRAEGVSSENNGDEAIHESDRSERSMNASPKAWAESPLKRPSIQRPPRGDTSNEAAYGQKPSAGYTDYDYSVDTVRSSEMVMRRPNERDTEREDGTRRPWYGEGLGELESNSTSVTYSQRNGYDWQKLPTRGPLIDAYGNYRGPKSARSPLLHVPNPHDITNKNSRLVPRNWQNSEEEEYMWEDMNARSMDHGRGSEKLRKSDWIPEDIDKPLGLGRGKRIGPEPDLLDGHLRTAGPLSQMDQPMVDEERIPRRELDDRLASPLMQHDLVARSGREVSMESSGLLRTTQNTLVPRSLPGWPQQHINLPPYSRPRVLSMDLPHQSSISSLNVGRTDGLAISSVNGVLSTSIGHSSGPRPSFRTNNGIGTGPPSFGALPPVTPLSSGLSARLRQSPKPHSPSDLPSMQSVPGSPTSSLPRQQSVQPVQHQQQNNFIRADHLQVQNQKTHPSLQHSHPPLPQIQQVLQPQTTSDSTSQLPHGHIQSGLSLQQLQMRQQIQSLQQFQSQPSAILPQQGQSMQFSQQVPTELPLPQIQPVSLSQPLIPTHAAQQSDLRTPLQPPPPSYGPPQTLGYPASGISANPTSLLQGQTNTPNLLDVIFKSGLLPPNTLQSGCNPPPVSSSGSSGILDIATTQASLHIQPPLPSGPPPVQFSAATTVSLPVPPAVPLPISTPVSSLSGPTPTSALGPLHLGSLPMPPQPLRPVQPPLPPGPPPASSLVGSTSQATSSVSAPLSSIHPVSNLLNSLVAKGFITAPIESASSSLSMSSTSLMSTQLNNYSTAVIATSSLQAPVSVPFASDNPFSTTVDVPPTSVSAVAPLESSGEAQAGKDQFGVEFKRGRILEYHPSVINALYDDFPKQCQTCGLRFISQEEHCKHMDWHALKNREQKSQRKTSRGWFRRLQEWVGGTVPAESAVAFSFSPQETVQNSQESEEPAVPFDENQPICHLCGEVFEEFYSHETDEWMCKGTVYLNAPGGTSSSIGSSARSLLGPIVHAKCRSESAAVPLVDPEENDTDDDVLGCRRKTVQY